MSWYGVAMAKPQPSAVPVKSETYEVRDVRVREVEPGVVEMVEIVLRGVPASTRVLFRGPRVVAMTDVRLYEEAKLGPDRYGDSGLGPKWNGSLNRPEYE
jgi:hypothetical protein